MLGDMVFAVLCLEAWLESSNFTKLHLNGWLITNNKHAGSKSLVHGSLSWCWPTIWWFVKGAHCIVGNASISNNGLTPLSSFPCYSALPQIPLPLLVLGVNLWPHKASIWVVSPSKVSHIDNLPELLRFTNSFQSTPKGYINVPRDFVDTLFPLWKDPEA
jgi:hypothetical protein